MDEYNLLIVSDLHLCEGFDPKTGRFSRLEDFLYDDAFARFLRYHETIKNQPRFGGRPWLLIFNGDLMDFMQVVSLPTDGRLLRLVRGVEKHRELPPEERDYGLGTTAPESEWKLARIARGHQGFFAVLGWFIACGNRVVVVKGNHDAEFYWPEVQERFREEVRRAYARERVLLGEGPPLTASMVKERIQFYPWFYYEPGRVYVEHGGQYESSCHFRDYVKPLSPEDPRSLYLPWGSMFVRYLFNKIEDVHPFADNVKPPTRYLMWAFRKDPLMTVYLVVTRAWIFARAYWRAVRRQMMEIASGEPLAKEPPDPVLVPLPPEVAARIAALARRWAGGSRQAWKALILQALYYIFSGTVLGLLALSLLEGLWLLAIVLLAVMIAAHLAHRVWRRRVYSFDDLLVRVARDLEQVLGPEHAVGYIVMGHDHLASIQRMERTWYVNTGAWVQLYERSGPVEGREALTFFRLRWGHRGAPELLRWDDAAGAPARLPLGLDMG